MPDSDPPPPSWRNYLLLILLLALTTVLVSSMEIRISGIAGIRDELPHTLGGDWSGSEVLFCQNQACGRSWLTREIEPDDMGNRICPRDWHNEPCGGILLTKSLGEKNILPDDTVITKKQYTREQDKVFCSVVFSGESRASFHRPEWCLVGQGHTIDSSQVVEIPLEGRDPMHVMVMDLSRKIGPDVYQHSYYAYWFVGPNRETPYHHERLLWMSLERILQNVSHRWAYISVSGARSADPADTSHFDEIREVVGDLYPQISLADTP